MKQADTAARIKRARELLTTVQNAAMATVNEDGSPHNTPYFFMRDDPLEHLYWSSNTKSLHSLNAARTGQIFVVLYEADNGGGLYIRADGAHATEGKELETALQVHNARRVEAGKAPLEPSYFQQGNQRMYVASVRQLWVNYSERDKAGNVIQDLRHEVSAEALLG